MWEWNKQLLNSGSFIGTVELPLKIVDTRKTGRFGVHTILSVNRTVRYSTQYSTSLFSLSYRIVLYQLVLQIVLIIIIIVVVVCISNI